MEAALTSSSEDGDGSEDRRGLGDPGVRLGGKRRRRTQDGKDRDIYGVFYDDIDEGGERGQGFARSTARRRESDYGLSKPVGFVSSGKMGGDPDKDKVEDRVNSNMEAGPSFGGHAGLGFQPSGDNDEGQERAGLGVLPSAFGQKVMKAAQKRRQQDKPKVKQAQAGAIGSFEKHTKGIGMKLLQKMGYQPGSGLGKEKQGIAAPVEAQVRPKGMALGFGEVHDKPAPEPARPPGETAGKSASAKPQHSWKKSRKAAKEKKRYKTADELLTENREDEAPPPLQTVIDMRGPQAKVVTKLERLNEVPTDAMAETTAMPELQYNMRLIVDLTEVELQKLDHKVRQEKETLRVLQEKVVNLQSREQKHSLRFSALKELFDGVNRISSNVPTSAESAFKVLEDFGQLKRKHPHEYFIYSIPVIALGAICSVIDEEVKLWNPFEKPEHLLHIFKRARNVLEADASSKGNIYNIDELEGHPLNPELLHQGNHDPFSILLRKTVCFQLQRAIRNDWDPSDPDKVIGVLEKWQQVLTVPSMKFLLGQVIFPKLRAAVEDWDPTKATIPIHVWVHPWLPFLSSQLTELYPSIRHKVSRALRGWKPSDPSAIALLSPWKPVFDAKSWEKFLMSNIVPKLEEGLKPLQVEPNKFSPSSLKDLLGWFGYLPARRICRLLNSSFFPKLHRALYLWLSDNPNFDEVVDWYEQWKALFPEDLQAQEEVRVQFNRCLLMMNAAVSGEDLSGYEPGKVIHEASHLEEEEREPAAAKNQSAGDYNTSLKELVEAYSAESGVDFLPKVGRFHEGLQVYSFGGTSVILDNRGQAIKALVGGKWVVTSLSNLMDGNQQKQET